MTRTKSQKLRARLARATAPVPKKQQVPRPPGQGKSRASRRRRNRQSGSPFLQTAGKVLANVAGMSATGRAVGTGLSRLFGQGDYRVASNSMFSNGMPTFSTLEAPMRFRHKELIGTVTSTTGFTVSKRLQINPGLLAPIIAQFARSFTMYHFHGLVFMFNSTSSDSVSSTNTALGVHGMVVNYDPAVPNFTSRIAAEEYVGCQAAPPSHNLMLPVECKPQTTMLERRYVRSTASVPTGKTVAECDLGTFQSFTDGMQAASLIGEIWVAYDVEFFLPKIDDTAGDAGDIYTAGAKTSASVILVGANPVKQTNTTLGADGLLRFNKPGFYSLFCAVGGPSSVNAMNVNFSGSPSITDLNTTPIPETSRGAGVVNAALVTFNVIDVANAYIGFGWSYLYTWLHCTVSLFPRVTQTPPKVDTDLILSSLLGELEVNPVAKSKFLQILKSLTEAQDEEENLDHEEILTKSDH